MKSFYEYLKETEKTYAYKVKTLYPLDEERMKLLEKAFVRYGIVSIDGPFESVTELNPLDFEKVKYATVFIVDVVTKIPVSPYYMIKQLKSVLEIPERQLVVRSVNDPLELETQEIQDRYEFDAIQQNNDLERCALMSTEPDYIEVDPASIEVAYGDEYNQKFLKKLASEENKEDRYGILKSLKRDDAEFNKDIKDIVNPVYDDFTDEEPNKASQWGEYVASNKERTRLLKNKKGEKFRVVSTKGKNNHD